MQHRGRQPGPRERLEQLVELAGGRCAWCGYDLAHRSARVTRDHLVPRIKGGPTRIENELAACASCNRRRGHTAPSAWIQQCRQERGLDPDVDLVAAQLERLAAAIEQEGGLRRIRSYLARERSRVAALLRA